MTHLIVHRRGYHRRDGTYVRPTTFPIRDRGHPGRTPESQRWFPKNKDHLVYDGEEWHADMSPELRHEILNHLAPSWGWNKIVHRLNALKNVSTSRKLDHAAIEDIKWIHKKKGKY